MCMQDLTWFQSFLGPMSDYANLFNGSGTLADCSPDGPPVGAYIFTYTGKIAPSTPLASGPITTLDSKGVFELIGKIRTTQEIEEPIPERMAALTHIHARLPADHFFKSTNTSGASRNGNVWSQTPVYGPTVEHMELEHFSGSCARYVKKVFNA
uniref:Capsid protein n=1 Tax=Rhizoctonia solani partitivirus 20 TaxID=3162544 RepID=A0AAU6MX92_9VIRU